MCEFPTCFSHEDLGVHEFKFQDRDPTWVSVELCLSHSSWSYERLCLEWLRADHHRPGHPLVAAINPPVPVTDVDLLDGWASRPTSCGPSSRLLSCIRCGSRALPRREP